MELIGDESDEGRVMLMMELRGVLLVVDVDIELSLLIRDDDVVKATEFIVSLLPDMDEFIVSLLPDIAELGVSLPGVAELGVSLSDISELGVSLSDIAEPGVSLSDIAELGVSLPDITELSMSLLADIDERIVFLLSIPRVPSLFGKKNKDLRRVGLLVSGETLTTSKTCGCGCGSNSRVHSNALIPLTLVSASSLNLISSSVSSCFPNHVPFGFWYCISRNERYVFSHRPASRSSVCTFSISCSMLVISKAGPSSHPGSRLRASFSALSCFISRRI